MPENKARITIALFSAFILVMSIGGLLTSWHLVKMHYEEPGRTLRLLKTYPVLKPIKKHIPKKYRQPVKIVADTKEEELKNMYNVFGTMEPVEHKPHDNKKQKESNDGKKEKKEDPFCTIAGGDCIKVGNSKFAEIKGIDVAIFGTAGYALLILFCVVILVQRPAKFSIITHLISLGAVVGFAFSVWLTALEAFVIHAFCPYCIVSAIFMTLIFIAVLIQWFKVRRA